MGNLWIHRLAANRWMVGWIEWLWFEGIWLDLPSPGLSEPRPQHLWR